MTMHTIETVAFKSVFDIMTFTRDRNESHAYKFRKGLHHIQGWCYVSSNGEYVPSFYANPTNRAVQAIVDNMIVDHDLIYFKAIVHEDSVDIYATYDQIIGSRLLFRITRKDWEEKTQVS